MIVRTKRTSFHGCEQPTNEQRLRWYAQRAPGGAENLDRQARGIDIKQRLLARWRAPVQVAA